MPAITPIGLRLGSLPVAVIGGGPVAARRARLLARAGAQITVIAPEVCEDMAELLRSLEFAHRTAGGEAPLWRARGFTPTDLDGVWMVAAATGNSEVDREVSELAHSLRVFCFKGGDAAGASAWAPALLSHGDTTIAVVSSGESGPRPTRTARLRDAIAGFLRARDSKLVDAGAVPYALPGELPAGPLTPATQGRVTLVGGGPGKTGLLTLDARDAIRSAQVLVIDRLAPRAVLGWVGPEVEVVDVGKSGGDHPVSQSEINAILVDRARTGKNVVRLKGGDPYVFGRGGEELDACRAAGVEVFVIPGVTSAVSVPAAAGIPVTHRGVSRGFTVLTAHSSLGRLPLAVDHTLVLLMGTAQLDSISHELIAQGNSPETPCALIEDGFGPRQRTTPATLGTLAETARAAGVRPPAITVVGEVTLRADVHADLHREVRLGVGA